MVTGCVTAGVAAGSVPVKLAVGNAANGAAVAAEADAASSSTVGMVKALTREGYNAVQKRAFTIQ